MLGISKISIIFLSRNGKFFSPYIVSDISIFFVYMSEMSKFGSFHDHSSVVLSSLHSMEVDGLFKFLPVFLARSRYIFGPSEGRARVYINCQIFHFLFLPSPYFLYFISFFKEILWKGIKMPESRLVVYKVDFR
jgi:hypothetical protein